MKGLIQESSSHYERGGTQKDEYSKEDVVEVACPFCTSERRERLWFEYEIIGISRCLDCSLIYTSPRTKAPEAVYWGDATKYETEARMVFAGRAPHHRDVNYEEELALVKRYKPSGRFLDVGCNMGFLLRKVKEMGWEAVGVEPSPALSKLAAERWGLPIHNCMLNELPPAALRSFDVVALSDVFEHITEPLPFLVDVQEAMKDDGILYVKVPNAKFSLFKQRVTERLGKKPRMGLWDSYEHVVHYTDDTLRAMLKKGGFDVLEVTFGKPVQLPSWHDHVGHYYLHTSPWYLDWKRTVGRAAFYYAGFPERILRGGKIGAMAPNLIAVARKSKP